MVVHDVNIPTRVSVEDIKNIKPKNESDENYWERRKTATRLRREALEEQKMIEQIENPPMVEPPFQVKGSVNLGNFDLQESTRLAQEKADNERREFLEREKELAKKLEETQKELTETKMTQAMREMGSQFAGVVKSLEDKLEKVAKGTGNPNDLFTYIDQMEKLADKMGYSRGGSSPVGDPRLTIELEKMRIEEAQRERQFQLDMKKFEYDMVRLSKKDEMDAKLKEEELDAKRRRDELFASAPEMIGRAIAKGMMDESTPAVPQGVQGSPSHIAQKAPQGKYTHITAAPGESGEMPCSGCNQPVMIGPSARRAVCANCNSVFDIKREGQPVLPQEDPIESGGLEEEDDDESGRRF